MTKIEMMFGGFLALVVVAIVGFVLIFGGPSSSADSRSRSIIASHDEAPTASVCGCYELAYDLGARAKTLGSPEYLGNLDLCYRRLERQGARAFETGYLAGANRIRAGRFCRERDYAS
ncbi:MAG: hypothetical protein AAF788_03540 [Pseudomonadota bacterium]